MLSRHTVSNMIRYEINAEQTNRELEKKILDAIKLDDSGFVIYEGDGPEEERKGSQIGLLIQWYLYGSAEKPLDSDIFGDCMKRFNIPRSLQQRL